MIKTIKYLLTALMLLPLFSFSQKVENIRFEQVGKQVYIYYDLIGTDTYNITIYCSEDNGNTWGSPLQEVSGDVGGRIIPGNSKKVVWDVLNGRTKLTGNIRFKIQVENIVLIDSRDGQKYKTVKIGNQVWMAENLNFKTKNSWCYDNDPANCDVYGRLYTWDDARISCPKGWHLPSDDEWKILEMYLGMSESEVNKKSLRGIDEGKRLKSKNGWYSNGNGTDEAGLLMLPGGYHGSDGSFSSLGYSGDWWSSSEYSDLGVWRRYLNYDYSQISRYYFYIKAFGFSVRCLKD